MMSGHRRLRRAHRRTAWRGIAGALINALHQRGEAFRQRRYEAAEAYLSDMDDARAALDDLVDIVQGKASEDEETNVEVGAGSEPFPTDAEQDAKRLRDKNIRRAKVLVEGKPLKARRNELVSLARKHLHQAQVRESRLSLLFGDRTNVLPAAAILAYELQEVHTILLEEMQKAQKEIQKAQEEGAGVRGCRP